MAKDLPAAVLTEIAAEQKKPRLLVELVLSITTTLYFVCDGKDDLVFPHGGAVTYSARAIKMGSLGVFFDGGLGDVDLKIDNVDKAMAAYLDDFDFEGATLTIKRVFLDSSNNAPSDATYYNEVFSGVVEKAEETGRHWLKIKAKADKPLKNKAITQRFTRSCRWAFGSDECNTDGYADLSDTVTEPHCATGTADSGTALTLVHSALTQADDHWNFGHIEITKAGVTYKRSVKDFDNSTHTITFDAALPVVVDNTTTYEVLKGCDKSFNSCQANNAWGPRLDNKNNFGGFIHLAGENTGKSKTIKEGEPIPLAYGLCQIPGNVVRVSDPGYPALRLIAVHGQGETDALLSCKINDYDFDFAENYAHWKDNKDGDFTQTPMQVIGSDLFPLDPCAYRGLAYTGFSFVKADRALSGCPKISVIARAKKCEPIGGGALVWSRNPAVILWDFLRFAEGYAASDLDEDAFNSLEELCAEISSKGDGSPIRPPGPSETTVKATGYFNSYFKPIFAVDRTRPWEGPWQLSGWLAEDGDISNQCFNADMGASIILTKIALVNGHLSGGYTSAGIKNFIIQGSNSASAFSNVTYSDNTGWTDIETGLSASAYSASSPEQEFLITSPGTAYRYYRFKIADNLGHADWLGFRDVCFWGRQPRFTFDYVFQDDSPVADARAEIASAFRGKVIRSQGKLKPVWPGFDMADGSGSLTTRTSQHAFTMDNIKEGSFSWEQPEKANTVILTYKNAHESYSEATVTVRDDADIRSRGEYSLEISCEFITGEETARRYANLVLREARYADYRCNFKAFSDSQHLELFDLVTVTHNLPGFSSKEFLVIGIETDHYGISEFTLMAYHSGVYDDSYDAVSGTYLSTLPNPAWPCADTDNLALTESSFFDNSGHFIYAVTLTYDLPDEADNWGYAAIYIKVNLGDYEFFSLDQSDGDGFLIDGQAANFKKEDSVYVKVVSVNTFGVQADISNSPVISNTMSLPDLAQAISDLPADGGRIVLPEGTYTLSAALDLPDKNITIEGVNKQVIIKNNAGNNLFVIHDRTKSYSFKDFTVESQNTTVWSYMFYIYGTTAAANSSKVIIDDVVFSLNGPSPASSSGDRAIYCNKGSGRIKFLNCNSDGGGRGIEIQEYTDVEIRGNFIKGVDGSYCVWVYDCDKFIITSNRFPDAHEFAIDVDSAAGAGKDGAVTKNFITSTHKGIHCGAGSTVISGNNIKISSSGASIYGIYDYDGDNCIITDNVIEIDSTGDEDPRGIIIAHADDCVVMGNKITIDESGGNTKNRYGILLSYAKRNNISNNHIDMINNNAKDTGVRMAAGAYYNKAEGMVTINTGLWGTDGSGGSTNLWVTSNWKDI